MNIPIIINDAPYGSEKAYNALPLALPHQKTPDDYYNLERMFKGLLNKGVQIKACGTCADARGLRELNLIEGIEISTMSQLTEWVVQADKVLTF